MNKRSQATASAVWASTDDRYMNYLTGCADLFRGGSTDVAQFTLTKG